MSSKQSGRRSVKGPTEQMKRRTLLLMAVCGIVAFIVLAFQLFKIQIIEHDKYEADALSQQIGTTSSIAERGTIYDTNMKALAMSSEVYTVFIDPKAITERNEDINLIADELNELLDVDRAEVISKMENKDSQYAVVARKVDPDIVEKIGSRPLRASTTLLQSILKKTISAIIPTVRLPAMWWDSPVLTEQVCRVSNMSIIPYCPEPREEKSRHRPQTENL